MHSILVTGTGGGVGQSIIKSLADTEYRVVAADGEVLGTGLYAADRAYRIPYASKPDFVDRLLEICRRERCALIFPGLDAELPILAANVGRFKEAGVIAVVSTSRVVDISDDKLATAHFLQDHGFPSPATLRLTDGDVASMPFPLILKPLRGGARSHGVFVVRDAAELASRRTGLPAENYVAQEQIVGDEYTCGTINFDGTCGGAIVMRRVLRDGDTYKAHVVNNASLTNFVVSVATALKPFGACNFQLRVRDNTPYVFEFNARCSGTTYCRTLAGFNEPMMIADKLLRGIEPVFETREISVLRYWRELVVQNDRIDAMQQQGEIVGDGSRL